MTFQKMNVLGHVINVNCAAIKSTAVVMTAMSYFSVTQLRAYFDIVNIMNVYSVNNVQISNDWSETVLLLQT